MLVEEDARWAPEGENRVYSVVVGDSRAVGLAERKNKIFRGGNKRLLIGSWILRDNRPSIPVRSILFRAYSTLPSSCPNCSHHSFLLESPWLRSISTLIDHVLPKDCPAVAATVYVGPCVIELLLLTRIPRPQSPSSNRTRCDGLP